MNMKFSGLSASAVACVGVILLFPIRVMGADAYSCPEKTLVSSTITKSVSEWEVVGQKKEHLLFTATFSDGHPEGLAFLKPSGGDASHSVYDLSHMVRGGAWLVCQYRNTPAVLTKKLPESYQVCRVSESVQAQLVRVACE